jgi:lipid-binding SYLF domain-containing protein
VAAVAACGLAAMTACQNAPKNEQERATLGSDSNAALNSFLNDDSTLRPMVDRAAGYAIFPDIGKAGLIAGGAHGQGEVYERGRLIGYSSVTQGTIGLQAGAETYSELIVFQDQATLGKFKEGNFTFSGNLSAVAIKPGAASGTSFQNGVAVFTRTKGGLMAEASVGGQKFTYVPR